jgi:hypothetical protein
MTARNLNGRQAALLKARERRQALDRDRDAKDQRIEVAAAAALMALDDRAEAQRAVDASVARVADAVRALLQEGVPPDRAAALLELDVAEVRRLSRAGSSTQNHREDERRNASVSGQAASLDVTSPATT